MRAGRIEREQLLHQGKGDAVLRRHVEAGELQRDVFALAATLEDEVLLLEIEQRPRGDRDNQLAIEGHGHQRLFYPSAAFR